MSIQSYRGNTFVGFLDISGFKELMKNREKARDTLDRFYKTIYNAIEEVNLQQHVGSTIMVNSIIISDCAILFLSGTQDDRHENFQDITQIEGLEKILSFIQKINREFILSELPFMTTCSIAYGDFEYRNKYDREYLRKNCIIGNAYMDAFLDSENSKPKIQPGECRVLKQTLSDSLSNEEIFSLLDMQGKYYYFYWMLSRHTDLKWFKQDYLDTYQLKFKGMISVLQRYSSNPCVNA